jgi:hypothetical protein
MYNSPKQKGVALKKWPLDANDVSLFKGYLKKITSLESLLSPNLNNGITSGASSNNLYRII